MVHVTKYAYPFDADRMEKTELAPLNDGRLHLEDFSVTTVMDKTVILTGGRYLATGEKTKIPWLASHKAYALD